MYRCLCVSEDFLWIRSTAPLTESSLCAHVAPELARLPKPRCSFVWLALLLFIPLPFRFPLSAADQSAGPALSEETRRETDRHQTNRRVLCGVNPVKNGEEKQKALLTLLLLLSLCLKLVPHKRHNRWERWPKLCKCRKFPFKHSHVSAQSPSLPSVTSSPGLQFVPKHTCLLSKHTLLLW